VFCYIVLLFSLLKELTHSLPVLVEGAELLAQPFLVLYCHFSTYSSKVTYGYTTETVPICISKAQVMFQSVISSVAHSKGEGKNNHISLIFLYSYTLIYGTLDKLKLSDMNVLRELLLYGYNAVLA
jgi:hypothetical protein